jgi:galactonate dehydratase
VRNTVQKIKAIREAVGPDIAIMLDVNNLLNVPSAIKLGRALEPFNLLFYEDVVRQDEGMLDVRKVKAAVKVPISSGENLYNVWQFREALELDAIDIVELDCAHCGGIAQSKKIAALAEAYHKPISPHNPNGPLATIQTAHVCASTPNFLILEILWPDVPWVNDVVSEPLKVRNGYLELPTKPGLGIEIDVDEVMKHPLEPGLLDTCILS